MTFLIQYKALYEATYRESANRRIRLAEVLRQLPLSFFGNRDLTDLTTTIMGDTETLEKAFSHFYPAMHGALISTALISAGMLLYDWRMALALLWVVPASLLMVYLSRRMEKRHIKKGLVTRRAATDAMQEVLDRRGQAETPPLRAFDEIVKREPYPVERKAKELVERLKRNGITRFLLLFRGSRSRSELVATFMAVLELCRNHIIRLAGSAADCTVTCQETEEE